MRAYICQWHIRGASARFSGSVMENVQFLDRVIELKERCEAKEREVREELGLTPGEYSCLRAFPEQEALDIGALSRLLLLSHSRTSRVVDKLVKRKLVSREVSESDRRAATLQLTALGLEAKNRLHQSLLDCEQRIVAEMSETERGRVVEALDVLRRAMG